MRSRRGKDGRIHVCAKRIMKGTIMNRKCAEPSRVASYGVALGLLLYAVWQGLVRSFAPKGLDRLRLLGRRL